VKLEEGSAPATKADEEPEGDIPKPPKVKTELEIVLLKAMTLKKKYITVSQAATCMMILIETNKAWEWAQGGVECAQLQSLQKAMNDSIDSFGQNFLASEFKDVKIGHDAAFLCGELAKFCAASDGVQAVQVHINKLNRMHKSSKE
jgi:hypothetical protein